MKKRFFASLLAFVMVSLWIVPASAGGITADSVIYYEDGSYAVISICSEGFARSSRDDHKTYTYYNSENQRCFAYTLYVKFTYDGVTSRADSADFAVQIYRQGWDMSSHSEYVSGSTAYGRAAFTGPDGQTRSVSLTLTCDKNGTVT